MITLHEKIIINDLFNKTKFQKWKRKFTFVKNYVEELDYENILSESEYKDFAQDIILDFEEVVSLDNNFNFKSLFLQHIKLNNYLKESKINALAYKAFLEVEQNETIKSVIRTFKPYRGYTNNCLYNLNSNVTGRLTVKKGPNILTLPRRCRSLIDSRFSGGKIISVDFNALEPRFCLKLSNKNIEEDLYEEINNLLNFDIDRSVIKRAVISVLYGAHFSSLKGLAASKSRELFECIHSFFNLEHILSLSSNIDSDGLRRNYFGRPLWNLEETKENILINNYIQSSAVDVALDYFYKLVNIFDNDKAVPVFLLHDAIIFDVDNDYIKEFVKTINKGYNHKILGNFPVKAEIFNNALKESLNEN